MYVVNINLERMMYVGKGGWSLVDPYLSPRAIVILET